LFGKKKNLKSLFDTTKYIGILIKWEHSVYQGTRRFFFVLGFVHGKSNIFIEVLDELPIFIKFVLPENAKMFALWSSDECQSL
jgi:hypothetical protein